MNKKNLCYYLFASLLLVSCSGVRIDKALRTAPNDWTQYGGSPQRMNASPSTLKPPFEEVWEYNALAGISASLLVRDSVIVVTTLNGELQAVNINSGKRLGYVALESAVHGTPALDNGSVIVPIAGGKETLVSMSLRNSSDRNWARQLGPIESSPLVVDDFVYVTTMEGIAYCLNKEDGLEVWQFKTGKEDERKPVRSSPATDGTRVFFGGDDGYLYALDKSSGALKWKFNAGSAVFATPVVIKKSVVFPSNNGIVYKLDAVTGTVQWQYEAGARVFGNAAASEHAVYVGSSDGACHAIDFDTGKRRWRFAAKSGVSSAPLVAGNVLYWGSHDRTLYALDAENGTELWKYDALGRIKVPPVIWGGLLLVTSEDKYIVALRPI
ncbi:MAG: PQQ-like beta-propeller repeat protein [Ignavibacteriae bacterium]|nr:PQQ-like beta-propeller repeat protein [Ignavibacteriota bacterium]